MPGKSVSTRPGRERLNRTFNFLLESQQTVLAVVDANPDDARRTGVWEKTDTLRQQMKGVDLGTNSAEGCLQAGDMLEWNIAEKPEREMKLLRFCPADRTTRNQRLQFALNPKQFRAYASRNCYRHKQPAAFGSMFTCHCPYSTLES